MLPGEFRTMEYEFGKWSSEENNEFYYIDAMFRFTRDIKQSLGKNMSHGKNFAYRECRNFG